MKEQCPRYKTPLIDVNCENALAEGPSQRKK